VPSPSTDPRLQRLLSLLTIHPLRDRLRCERRKGAVT
jgi:hypothetical protein